MRHIVWTLAACLLVFPLAAFSQDKDAVKDKKSAAKAPPPSPFRCLDGRTIVFAFNGAGDSTDLTDNLREAVGELRASVFVRHVKWCRSGEPKIDYRDQEAMFSAAHRTAGLILAIRQDAPHAQLVFMGHSTGTRVALATAEMLPPGAIDRIFLFASAVSCSYELRPALKVSRGGIDAFFSRDDGVLEHLEENWGTADGLFTATAGRVGFAVPRFHPPPFPPPPKLDKGPKGKDAKKDGMKDGMKEGKKKAKDMKVNPDVELYQNLRQLCWNDELPHGFGHGGHHTFIHFECLKRHILPQLGCGPTALYFPR